MPQTTATQGAEATLTRLDRLAGIGALAGGGITRPGLSAAEQDACELVAGWCRDEGLEVSYDAAGNLYGRLEGSDPAAGEVWTGSHLDTVPAGGRFDGALGVVAGLAAVCALRDERPRSTLVVVVFRDEEGWRFGGGCFGSRHLTGAVGPTDLAARDAAGMTVSEALAALRLPAPASAPLPAAFVEVHVEQGPVLDTAGVALGDVTSIVGMAGFAVTFDGASGHAGTLPMAGRQDAFVACAEFALRLRECVLAAPGAVVTMGEVAVPGGAANVVPGRGRATVDLRTPDAGDLAALAGAVPRIAAETAAHHGCVAGVVRTWLTEPVELSARVRRSVRAAAAGAAAPMAELASGAGHDAGVLAAAGVEAGMLFVRSRNGGRSHHPAELSAADDIAAAVAVLADTLRLLA